MERRRSILTLGLGAAADALLGCSSDAPESAPPVASAPLPPAEVPHSLRGACAVPAPGRLFELASKRYDLPLVGSTWASYAVGALGLPITASEAFDLAAPLRVALLELAGGASLGAALALPLRAPDRLIAVASLGGSAPFRSLKDEALRGERLTPATGEARFDIGVLRNHLVVCATDTLADAGPFMADPAQPLFTPKTDAIGGFVAGSALAWLLERLLARMDSVQQGLFANAAPTLPQLKSAVAAIAEVPFQLAVGEGVSALSLTLEKTPALAAPLESLSAGELGAVLAADRDASIALGVYQAEPGRVKSAEQLGSLLSPLGLASEPPEAVGGALAALARARADGFQLAVERGPSGALAYGACDLVDDDAAKQALALLTKAVVEPQKDEIVSVRIVDTRLTLIGEAVHFFIERAEPGKDPQAEPTKKRLASILMRVENGRLALATGADPVAALRKALRRRAEDGPASLADLAVVKAVVSALPASAALYAFFDPARWLDEKRPSGDAERDRSALLLALQIAAEQITLTLALEPTAARALARQLYGTL